MARVANNVKQMKSAQYYNMTNKLESMLDSGTLACYGKGQYKGLFICIDTNAFWVSRVLEGYNSNFERESGAWLVEQNKLDKYEFCAFVKERTNATSLIFTKRDRDCYIAECFTVAELLEFAIRMDDAQGLKGFDVCQCASYADCIKVIDGGYGILELEVTK